MIAIECVCTRVRRGARALTGLYDGALAPTGITVAQFSLLRQIERMAPVGVSDLAQATGHDRSTLARTLRPLEHAGLIEIQAGADRRKRLNRLSVAGRAKVAEALPYWQQAQQRAETALGNDRDQLFNLLERFEQP